MKGKERRVAERALEVVGAKLTTANLSKTKKRAKQWLPQALGIERGDLVQYLLRRSSASRMPAGAISQIVRGTGVTAAGKRLPRACSI